MISPRLKYVSWRASAVFGVDSIHAHAKAIFDHRHGIVAEAAERAQIARFFAAPCAPVRDVLHGSGRRLAEDAQLMVAIKPFLPAFSIFRIAVIRPWAERSRHVLLHRFICKLYFAVGAHLQFLSNNESRVMRGG